MLRKQPYNGAANSGRQQILCANLQDAGTSAARNREQRGEVEIVSEDDASV